MEASGHLPSDVVVRLRRQKAVDSFLQLAQTAAESPLSAVEVGSLARERQRATPLPADAYEYLRDLYRSAVATALRDERLTIAESEWLRGLAEGFELNELTLQSAHRDAFIDVVESAIADGRVTHEEDAWVLEVRSRLDVPPELVRKELSAVSQLKRAAAAESGPLSPVPTEVRLQRGETPFFSSAATELKRVLSGASVRQGVRHSEYAYEHQDHGQLVVTNARVLFVGSGSRAIKLEKIQRIEADAPEKRLSLSVDGRKTPLVFGVDDAAVANAVISRLSKELEQLEPR